MNEPSTTDELREQIRQLTERVDDLEREVALIKRQGAPLPSRGGE